MLAWWQWNKVYLEKVASLDQWLCHYFKWCVICTEQNFLLETPTWNAADVWSNRYKLKESQNYSSYYYSVFESVDLFLQYSLQTYWSHESVQQLSGLPKFCLFSCLQSHRIVGVLVVNSVARGIPVMFNHFWKSVTTFSPQRESNEKQNRMVISFRVSYSRFYLIIVS